MFIGTHDRALDDKGRLVLPAPFRRELEDGGVLAPWDRCLALWTNQKFEDVMEKLLAKVSEGEADDDVARLFQANAWAIQPDGQGRFHIPDKHRSHADISREVTVVGQFNRIEIWDAGSFAALEQTKSATDVSSELRRLRIF